MDSTTVHLKGFASGLDEAGQAFEAALALPELAACEALVWDGDTHAEDSFTALIAALAQRRPALRLVAFLVEEEAASEAHARSMDGFARSWGSAGLLDRIERRTLAVPAGAASAWEELGVAALLKTGATAVVCLGGGACVRSEQLRAPANVTFTVVAADRPAAVCGGGREAAAIPRPAGGEPTAMVYRVPGGGGGASGVSGTTAGSGEADGAASMRTVTQHTRGHGGSSTSSTDPPTPPRKHATPTQHASGHAQAGPPPNGRAKPLGISLAVLLPLTSKWKALARNDSARAAPGPDGKDGKDELSASLSAMELAHRDDRLGAPKIELLQRFRPELAAVYGGGEDGALPTTEAGLLALGQLLLKQLCAELWIVIADGADGEAAAPYVAALLAPATTTADVCHFAIVKPDCAPHGVPYEEHKNAAKWRAAHSSSYCEMLQERGHALDDAGRPLVGEATHFISHAWSYDFEMLVEALYGFHQFERERGELHYYWIDIFCVDQHKAGAGYYDSNFWEEAFQAMVKSISHTVCIVSPWRKPVAMTRIWCLWELFSTLKHQVQLSLVMNAEDKASYMAAPEVFLDGAMAAIEAIDAQNAEASNADDLKMIGDKIRASEGGFEQINWVVRRALHEKLLCFLAFAGETERIAALLSAQSLAPAAQAQLVKLARHQAAPPARISLELPISLHSLRALTAFAHAAINGHLPTMKLLLAHGALPAAADDRYGLTALHIAVLYDQAEVVAWLVEDADGPQLDAFGLQAKMTGFSPAFFAAMLGRLSMLKLFLRFAAGADDDDDDADEDDSDGGSVGRASSSELSRTRSATGETLIGASTKNVYRHLEVEMHVKLAPDPARPGRGLHGHRVPDAAVGGRLVWDEEKIVAERQRTAAWLRLHFSSEMRAPLQEFSSACIVGDAEAVRSMLRSAEISSRVNQAVQASKPGDERSGGKFDPPLAHILCTRDAHSTCDAGSVAVLALLLKCTEPRLDVELRSCTPEQRQPPRNTSASHSRETALHVLASSPRADYAADDGSLPQIYELLVSKGGADTAARSGDGGSGFTPLHMYASCHKPGLVEAALRLGCGDVNAVVISGPRDGATALDLAAPNASFLGEVDEQRRLACVALLEAAGGKKNEAAVEAPQQQAQVMGVAELVAMGFEEEAVKAALAEAKGDANAAIDLLFG